eukprot:CAMPEP_0117650862 /NCGR_PEP_ID=MMETSP0804-20121206/1771_1 /TAXON_ID=1074897 /ORGANISM="Tetraselmis astigmatica, Strain CCMP880" /LENGTH=220 /DNA_ID=CAMNT_0005456773 /DNA_START=396 /DNA_END=1058 /DNA_ORIENTATION=-
MNHISRVCENVHRTKEFYETVLGFVEVRRPTQLEEDFEGSWLFNYGIGIHLIAGKPTCCPRELNPKDDHLSFQCESFTSIVDALEMDGIPYKRTVVRHQGMYEINQVFFHDPDHNMIEICTCECMPVTPLNDAYCGLVQKASSEALMRRRSSPTSSLDLTALESLKLPHDGYEDALFRDSHIAASDSSLFNAAAAAPDAHQGGDGTVAPPLPSSLRVRVV